MLDSPQHLERRYVSLAAGLKACWAFERFYDRLRRAHPRDDLEDPGVDFSTAQSELTSIAQDLQTTDNNHVAPRFDRLEAELRCGAARLSAQDSRIGAADLRRFLSRVRRLDEDLLLGMLSFYQFSNRGESWSGDRVDKVDFLMSRLGEQISGPLLRRDMLRLRSALAMLWEMASVEPPRPHVVRALRQEVREIGSRLPSVHSFDELEEVELLGSYRRLKHGIGRLLVEPSVAQAVLRTNAALGRAMQRFYGDEEWSIAADLARFARLEETSDLSAALGLELGRVRRDLERIEEGRRVDDVRFETVQRVRRRVKALRPYIAEVPLPPSEPLPDATVGLVETSPAVDRSRRCDRSRQR